MDLNKLNLDGFTIASLYRDTLVSSLSSTDVQKPVPPSPKTLTVEEPPAYRGKNLQHIVILVNGDEEPELLENILKSCRLNIDDIAIVDLSRNPPDYKNLVSRFQPKLVILFGIKPAQIGLPMNFPVFQLQSFTTTKYLHAPSLPILKSDAVLRSKLWVTLKKLFGIE
jgi:hypothetical protein